MSAPHSPPDEPRSFLGAWLATLLLIVAFVLGLLALPPLFDAPTSDAPSNILFFGRFHPMVVHAPVGALILLVLMEMLCLTRRGESRYGSAALLTLWVGSAGAIMAVFAGIMLSREGGYVSGNFTLHQGMGIIGTAGVLVALVVRLIAMSQSNGDLLHAYRAIFFLSFGIMGLGAHFGGNMSHGNKYLTEHAPPELKTKIVGVEKWMLSFVEQPKEKPATLVAAAPATTAPPAPTAGSAPAAPKTISKSPPIPDKPRAPAVVAGPVSPGGADKFVFQDVVLPIFEAKCNKCHNEDKAKGDLRLDNFEMVMKGGENGGNIVPGKPDESLSLMRIFLPVDDDEHMPPDGKEQLSESEVALIKWWVSQGASNTQKLTDAQIPAEAQPAVDAVLKTPSKQKLSAASTSSRS